jgi:hypothetical protein
MYLLDTWSTNHFFRQLAYNCMHETNSDDCNDIQTFKPGLSGDGRWDENFEYLRVGRIRSILCNLKIRIRNNIMISGCVHVIERKREFLLFIWVSTGVAFSSQFLLRWNNNLLRVWNESTFSHPTLFDVISISVWVERRLRSLHLHFFSHSMQSSSPLFVFCLKSMLCSVRWGIMEKIISLCGSWRRWVYSFGVIYSSKSFCVHRNNHPPQSVFESVVDKIM